MQDLFANNYREDEKLIIQKIFMIEPISTPFLEININEFFMVPDTRAENRYWRTPLNEYAVYFTPTICKKIGEQELIELMMDYPVAPRKISLERMSDRGYRVQFN